MDLSSKEAGALLRAIALRAKSLTCRGGKVNYFIILAIVIPFLFLIGVIYNALKEQKKLEAETLPKFLAQRQAKGNPYSGDAYADEDDDDYAKRKAASPQQSSQAQQKAQNAATADLVASISAAIGTAGVAEAQDTLNLMQNAQIKGKNAVHTTAHLIEEQEPSRVQEGKMMASDFSNANNSYTAAVAYQKSNNASNIAFSEDSPLLAAVQNQPLADSNLDADSAAAYFARYHATANSNVNSRL